ncbi:hypothetical protein DR950_17695 [Kitasatospora xanthocidica]|uniref:Uncharacterized protein n=1 Tax=Kitasatospora xanthocidica TaxID=83382 RepID=A0A372ZVP1_9ACTN|nr:hypothetical protein [Kitasatospora xanthocidica]RGD59377.1 hypothetical protein DR950_17695 [Kitasatospora xanthocidica]
MTTLGSIDSMAYVGTAATRGLEHHEAAIIDAITSSDSTNLRAVDSAFTMVDHAITIGWAIRPDAFRALAFTQFHELVRNRYYADLYRHCLALDADADRIAEVASGIAVALVDDPQLNP